MAKSPIKKPAAKPAAKASTSRAVAMPSTPKGGSLVTSVDADEFAAYANAGRENVTTRDMIIPRLAILQKLSPQIDKKNGGAQFIEGAEVGDIVDVTTGDLFKEGLHFLPCYFITQWLEWAPRKSGKGLIATHDDDKVLQGCTQNDKKQWVNKAGNYIAQTAQFYGLNLSVEGVPRPSFIPMASSQLKAARKWNTLAGSELLTRKDGSSFIAPLFYRTYELTSGEESNSEGDWMGWVVSRSVALPELGNPPFNRRDWNVIKDMAIAMLKSIQSGAVRAQHGEDMPAEANVGDRGDDRGAM